MSTERSDASEAELMRRERDALSSRIAALEDALVRERDRFDVFAATLPGVSWEMWGEPYVGQVNYVSASVEAITGYSTEDWQSRPGFCLDRIHPDDRDRVVHAARASIARGDRRGFQEYRLVRSDGVVIHFHERFTILRGEDGEAFAWQAFSLDVTALREAEAQRDRMQAELIHSQAELLGELSTPLLPIAEGVVVMPLIGRIDRARVEAAIQVLLPGLAESRARYAILDITGVPELDSSVASALLSAARATALLGVEMLITGVRPEVAMTFCALEQRFEITTLATLQTGVHYAMQGSRARARPR